jgi:hypothetical protein
MSVAGQAVNPASVLCQFLDEVLLDRQLIAEEGASKPLRHRGRVSRWTAIAAVWVLPPK